jgi:hypothetical protein
VSTFRPKGDVMAHYFGLKLFYLLDKQYSIHDPIPASYYEAFARTIFVVKTLLFLLSVLFFYRLALLYFIDPFALACTILYVLYPSVLMYVSIYNIYESVIGPLLVIIMSIHLTNNKEDKDFSPWQILLLTIAMPLICLLKLQVTLIFIIMFGIMLVQVILTRNYFFRFFKAYAPASVVLLLLVSMIFAENYKLFHQVVFSTQSAVNLWHGHNPYARGSWTPSIWRNHADEIDPILQRNKDILSSDEITETGFYKKWAMTWIRQHPGREAILCMRKAGIYFLPYNFDTFKINLYTSLTHVAFLGFIFTFFRKNYKDISFYYLLAPIVAIFLTSELFFVEYRWRYLTDPFMLLLGLIFIRDVFLYFNAKKQMRFSAP